MTQSFDLAWIVVKDLKKSCSVLHRDRRPKTLEPP